MNDITRLIDNIERQQCYQSALNLADILQQCCQQAQASNITSCLIIRKHKLTLLK